MSAARQKAGSQSQHCEFCAHYESQMHASQSSERQTLVLLHAVERQLELERQSMNKQQNYITELESNLQTVSEETKQQVRLICGRCVNCQIFFYCFGFYLRVNNNNDDKQIYVPPYGRNFGGV